MSASPHLSNSGMVTFAIKVAGSPISDALNVLSIKIEKKVNRISAAKIVIMDGERGTSQFEASSSNVFVPGAAITIEAGYGSANRVVFSGIITGQSIRINQTEGPLLEVECRDEAVKMSVGRKSRMFYNTTDSAIISSIIANYAGLTSSVTATTGVLAEQVQYYATDWDFIVARAEINGLIVTNINGNVAVIKPDADTKPVLGVAYGDSLLEFNADLNSVNQFGNVMASTWDYKNQTINSFEAANNYPGPGNLSSKSLSAVVGLPDFALQTPASLNTDDLTNWSNAQLVKSEFSKILGEAKFRGSSMADPGKYIALEEIGDRFSGDHLISGVVHHIAHGNWETSVTIGLSPTWSLQRNNVMAPPASGILPGARGLFTGTVKKMYGDPDAQYRILVDVPLFDKNGEGIWARLSNFYSTSNAGAFFLPEVGDEVVLGFLNEDPRCPVILGSVYSSSKIKPDQRLNPDVNNSLKAIVSKSGVSIIFDDQNKEISVSTPGKNTVILSDKDGGIALKDANGNSIIMSANGITIKSAKDINIEAGQKINLKASQGLTADASGGDIELNGINIKETAQSQYSAHGNMTATITSSMELTLKGAMIMIN